MKKQLMIGLSLGVLLLLTIGAYIDSRSFNQNQFNTAGNKASIKDGALQTNVTAYTAAVFPSSGSTAYLRVAPTNNVTVTNYLGVVQAVSGSVVTFDCNQTDNFTVTNRLTAATTLVITNSSSGRELSAFVLGEASGGTSRVLTIQPDLGNLILNEDTYGTVLTTSYALTLTNGNAVEIRDSVRKLNGTNIHAIVTKQGSF